MTENNNNNETTFLNKLQRTEDKVGIQLFLGKGKQWSGKLKNRFCDFIVNEIDENNNVVRLKSLDYIGQNTEDTNTSNDGERENELKELIGESKFNEFLEFYNGINKTDPKSSFLFEAENDKDKRTSLHKLIKLKWKMATETVTGTSVIKVLSERNRSTKKLLVDRYGSNNPKYVEFTLCKENRETMEILNLLAKFLCQSVKLFSIAGTKDKRGITTQKVTVYKVLPERLADLNKRLIPLQPQVRIGEFKFTNRPLELGNLNGNRFNIVIRDVQDADDQVITDSIEEFKITGFVNYFGMQRFGTGLVSTHDIGRALIKGDFEKVHSLLMDPREGEKENAMRARKFYKETGDVVKTIGMIPYQLTAEKMFLIGLKSGKSKEEAFENIPRTLRTLYTHSYQSYLWNHAATQRIKLYGTKVVVGDLVVVSEEIIKPISNNNNNEDPSKENNVTDESNNNNNEEEVAGGDDTSIDNKKEMKVEHVTQEDIDNNKYTIRQVVLPLIGSKTLLPNNEIKDKYKELLAFDGLSMENIEAIENKVYRLKGAYRKLIEFAGDVKYKIYNYNDPIEQLSLSDIDILQNKPEPESIPDGKFKALRIEFNLPSSTYATMAYREILKTSSDISTQMAINTKDDSNNVSGNKRKLDEISNSTTTSNDTEEPLSKKLDTKDKQDDNNLEVMNTDK